MLKMEQTVTSPITLEPAQYYVFGSCEEAREYLDKYRNENEWFWDRSDDEENISYAVTNDDLPVLISHDVNGQYYIGVFGLIKGYENFQRVSGSFVWEKASFKDPKVRSADDIFREAGWDKLPNARDMWTKYED